MRFPSAAFLLGEVGRRFEMARAVDPVRLTKRQLSRLQALYESRQVDCLDDVSLHLLHMRLIEDGGAVRPLLRVTAEGMQVLEARRAALSAVPTAKRYKVNEVMIKALRDVACTGRTSTVIATLRALERRDLVVYERNEVNLGRWRLTWNGEELLRALACEQSEAQPSAVGDG